MAIKITIRREQKPRCGLALGGLGSGWFELRADGQFCNWNIFNNEPYSTGPKLDERARHTLFFLIRWHEQGGHPQIKILQMPDTHDAGSIPSQFFAFPYMTGVERIDYEASFPFSRLRFTDPEMPLVIELEAFSPFIPHDVKNSSLPGAIFNFTVRSLSKKPVEVMLLATMMNLIGHDVSRKRYAARLESGADYRLVEVGAGLLDPTHDTAGTQALASLAGDTTYHLGWDHRHPYYEKLAENPKLPDVDDTANRNYRKDEATGELLAAGDHKSSLAVSRRLKPRGGFGHTFLMTWHIPNRYSGVKNRARRPDDPKRLEGYAYANHFQTAGEVARYMRENLQALTERTRQFHRNFFDSTAPRYVLEQVNSHLNTFLTSAWLTKSGDFGVQEGITAERSWGPLATIDVGFYGSVMTAALFPELDQAMMRAHARLQAPSGEIGHGVDRNFAATDISEHVKKRLDLPSQFAIMTLRGFLWTADRKYLRELWPHVKRALEYVLRERDINGDLLPDMEGAMCTYDNFPMYGAASYVAGLWLSALAHAVVAARSLGDTEAERRYAGILEKADRVFQDKLWNGRYFRLYNDVGGPNGGKDEGCLTDQIAGQWTNHLAGLGELFDPKHTRKALAFILKHSRRPWGLVNCRWPTDKWLHPIPDNVWADQANTCWTGVELAFASLLIYEGLVKEGLEVIRNVDERYRRAGLYFDHQEWGGHYYRPMSSWAIINALLGLTIHDGCYEFAPRLPDKNQKLFFAVPNATGHYTRKVAAKKETITLTVATGSLQCRELVFALTGKRKKFSVNVDGALSQRPGKLTVSFAQPVTVKAGESLKVLASS
jgi:uncharacterized protein (DUF608 family)